MHPAQSIATTLTDGLPTPAIGCCAHRTIVPRRGVDLVLIGARGQVGRALRAQLAREGDAIARRSGVALRVVAAFDRHGFVHEPRGLDPAAIDARVVPRASGDWAGLRAALGAAGAARAVVVDCTASVEIADLYADLLGAGVAVATPNKHANAGPLAQWHALHATAERGRAPYRYETTVGAALPVLGTLADLSRRGERVRRIEAVLSGSLSLILARLHAGVALTAAVAEARALGYTEPDPREDLAARDLARKALILARCAEFALEPDAVAVEPLVDGDRWPDAGDDRAWRERIAAADARGERMVAVVSVTPFGAVVAQRSLPLAHPLARVAPGENLVRIHTEHHDPVPLAIGGPGAGPAVTAAGLLGDVIGAACELASS